MDPHDSAASARRARLLAATVGFMVLGLVCAFVLMVVFIQDEVPLLPAGPVPASEVYPRGGLVFVGTVNVWEVHGQLLRGDDRQVSFALDLTGPTGQPAPMTLDFRLKLVPERNGPGPQPLPHRAIAPGRFTASTQLPQSGGWSLRLELPDIAGVFRFEVDD